MELSSSVGRSVNCNCHVTGAAAYFLVYLCGAFPAIGWLVVDGWCWFVLREKYCWLVVGGWFVLREKYC
jgi:hypothetical protein